MAAPHCKVKNGKRGNGASHAQYVAGEDRYSEREDVLKVVDGNLPQWAANAEEFFVAADEKERANGRVYKEIEAAIPREAKDPVQWAKDYARDLLGDKHPYRLGIHDKEAGDGGRNVHMHLMFSTRTMDGHERDKDKFFSRAAVSLKKNVPADPAKGGAPKSEYWNSRDAVQATRSKFEKHVQRVAPDFKLARSDAPEPKIGPDLKRAGKNYAKSRENRAEKVTELRTMKKDRAELDKEIAKEEARQREPEKPKSKTDEMYSRFEAMYAPQGRDREGKDAPKEKEAKAVDWSQFRDMTGGSNKNKAPDWSQFRDLAGDKTNEGKEDKVSDLPKGPGYFPEAQQDKAPRDEQSGLNHRLEEQNREQSEQQRTERSTDDLYERMEKEREERERKEQEHSRDDDYDFH